VNRRDASQVDRSSSSPLAGVIVVALEQAVAAPFATRQLAELGARVIKVERPGKGDFARLYDEATYGLSSHFVWLNRGKESIELDLKDSADLELLWRMIERADVLVQNLAPGAARRLGLDPQTVRAKCSRLIYCGISGYGESGPYSSKKAYDLLVQAEAGLLSIAGTEREPAKAGIPVADISAGMYALTGILTALYQRHETGQGSILDVTMLDALSEWMGYPLYFTIDKGVPPARSGAHHATIAPYGPFTAGDGETVYLAVQNEREWTAFCADVLFQPELTVDPRFARNSERVAYRETLEAHITGSFASITAEQVIARLERAGIAHATMRTVNEMIDHPQFRARHRWRTVPSPVGPLPALLPPVTSDGYEPTMGEIPALGSHSEALRREFLRDVTGPHRGC